MAGKKNKAPSEDPIARFMALFPGNPRSSGRFIPVKDKMHTEYAGVTPEDVAAHLEGKVGVGVVPIMDDNSCMWAAIDIDNHDSDEDIPLKPLEELIRANRLPLLACRSKSGGIHTYMFCEKLQPASRVRILMGHFARVLGHPKAEIFPKQGLLTTDKDGKKAFGNWLNLPYMGGDKTVRYAVYEGKKLSLPEFLDRAETSRATEADLRAIAFADHPDAPPCIQKMFAQGVGQGQRNESLYNIVVYYKKVDQNVFEAKAIEANSAVFGKPLPRAEMLRTISSASRPECGYRCNEEPLRSLCERDACLKRKYGITPADANRLDTFEALPGFTNLVKYISEPVRWEMEIDGMKVTNLSTPQLLDWREMRQLIADRLTRIVPMIKGQEWERILNPLMKEARIVETPDDASVTGLIRARLREFASKCDLMGRGEDIEDRKGLLRGMPVVQKYQGDRMVIFRAEDFVNYLKRTRSEELKGINLWFAVKELGTGHTKMRVPPNDNINIWYLPVHEVMRGQVEMPAVKFKTEL